MIRFLLANVKAAGVLALGSIAASDSATSTVLAVSAAIVVGAVVLRGRARPTPEGFWWFVCAMAASSVMAVEAVSSSRHVIGLSIALAFWLGLLASRSLAGRRGAECLAVAAALGSTLLGCELSSKRIRWDAIRGYPATSMMSAVQRATVGRPFGVAGTCNLCVCAYMDRCAPIGPPQGYTSASQCALFEDANDIIVLRIDWGAVAAVPCAAGRYHMLGRYPDIGMEVWGLGGQ